jgi:TolA-binding protein
MKRAALLLFAFTLCCGCAAPRPGEKATFLQTYSESRRLSSALSSAVALLQNGETAGASKALEAICNDTPLAGVTDEALFRLALLSLKPSTERPASPQAHQLLKRLKKDYPSSPWSAQAAPLVELVNSAEELRRQNRNYRTANQSQTREINELNKSISELNKSIEQLKHLDQELERKTR